MSPVQTILAAVFAIGIPSVFLLIIYTLDLYASRTFRLVLLCFGWGGVGGIGLAYLFNVHVALPLMRQWHLDYVWLFVAFAPFAEEILKSLWFVYVSRRSEFTYFVDGAIYGFAAGIGFSIAENFFYMDMYPGRGLALTLVRSFSVCLMHGTASGLVGAAVGRFRFQKRSGQGLALLGGWGVAILLHALFNSVSKTEFVSDLMGEGMVVPLQVGIGLAGVGLIAFFISLGLREQRQWFAETLDRKMGVSKAEVRAAQAYATIDELLEPIAEQFPQQAEQVQDLLLSQAQMGIKRKVQEKLSDPKLKQELGEEITELQAKMEQLRKGIGPYVMTYVRMVFPEGLLDVWARLVALAVQSGPPDVQRWADMLEGKPTEEKVDPSQFGIFAGARKRSADAGNETKESLAESR
jgi:RsiW-degrading membrane proteinase PrsW (M82 family)